MKHSIKLICVLLLLIVFAFSAVGCMLNSSKIITDNVGEHASNNNRPSIATNTEPPTANTELPTTTAAPATHENAEYSIGEGKAITYSDSIGSVWVQISVPIINTGNTNLYIDDGTMDLEDQDGHLFDSIQMVSAYPTVIAPGETAWYYEETILDEAPSSELSVIPHVDVKRATVDFIRYDVSDATLGADTYGGIKITGRVENTTSESDSFIYVIVLMYDHEDNFLGQAFTILTDEIQPGEKIGFSASTYSSYSAFTPDNVGRYEIFAYPNQYQFN